MTEDEAHRQVVVLARRLGFPAPPPLPVRAVVGEAILGFAHAGRALRVSALVHRFRAEPRPGVVAAVLAAATPANSGGGVLVEDGRLLVLRRDFTAGTPDQQFADDVHALARASLHWTRDLFARVAESVGKHHPQVVDASEKPPTT